jgi:MinD-like ATPase involved in chromosome partitioning or flagellar assembly
VQLPEAREPETREPAAREPAPEKPAPQEPVSPVLAEVVGLERERPLPSIERALSGPGSGEEVSWRRQVKVVAGGQGPGKRDREALDRDRARTPLAGPRRIVVLGCTRGAGQTLTALMTSHILATVRGIPVAALDLNPGPTSLAARRSPAVSIDALLASRPGDDGDPGPGARLDVIGHLPGNGHGNNGRGANGQGNDAAHALDGDDFRRLADVLAERYLLTMIDPAASGLTRVLSAADLLVLVAPASPDAATSLANTQQWLGAHGHGELAGRAVTVVNGVSRRTRDDVLRAESVARGRCRAIVRVPWDDLLSSHPGTHRQTTLQPQTRLAYTALAGVVVTGLAGAALSPSLGAVTEGNPW